MLWTMTVLIVASVLMNLDVTEVVSVPTANATIEAGNATAVAEWADYWASLTPTSNAPSE